ncbi:hypothetical protein [Streptomyces sp. SD15]
MPRPSALLCALAAAAAPLPAIPAQATAPETQALHFDACPRLRAEARGPGPRRVRADQRPTRLEPPPGTAHRGGGLARTRLRHACRAARLLLVNPGGPGGSGLPYAVTKRAKLPESVRRAYDIIGFDPRGVGQSAPADCGAMGGLFGSPGADPVPVERRLTTSTSSGDSARSRVRATSLGGGH